MRAGKNDTAFPKGRSLRRSKRPPVLLALALSLAFAPFAGQGRAHEDDRDLPIVTSRATSYWPALPQAGGDAPGGTEDPRDRKIRELERRLQALESTIARSQVYDGPPAPPVATAAARRTDGGVDALAAERALERTLVRTGVTLLQAGQIEVEPSLTYRRFDTVDPLLVTVGGATDVANVRALRDELSAQLTGRVGLPWDAQIEVTAGVEGVNSNEEVTVPGLLVDETSDEGVAFSDVQVSLAKTLYRPQGPGPDIIGRITWDSASGSTLNNNVGFSNGFHEVSASLVALTRQDPLVFVGSLGYGTTFERDGVRPGDQVNYGATALLAVSPETSMRLGFSGAFAQKTRVNGATIATSDATSAVMTIGFSSIVSRNTLVDVGLDVGLTDDSPQFAISLSLPTRIERRRRA